jgi:hypothetical protein
MPASFIALYDSGTEQNARWNFIGPPPTEEEGSPGAVLVASRAERARQDRCVRAAPAPSSPRPLG